MALIGWHRPEMMSYCSPCYSTGKKKRADVMPMTVTFRAAFPSLEVPYNPPEDRRIPNLESYTVSLSAVDSHIFPSVQINGDRLVHHSVPLQVITVSRQFRDQA